MTYREATVSDIAQIQIIRHSVRENVLSDPALVTDEDCVEYLTRRGKGWVCEIDGEIVGFAIVDLHGHNVWALFLKPEFEGRRIGGTLHKIMLDWYFEQSAEPIWLGTDPGTRAEGFYRKLGWKALGLLENGELKFEMTIGMWQLDKSRKMNWPGPSD